MSRFYCGRCRVKKLMDINHNFKIQAPIRRVYEAITSQQGINGWWAMDADVMQRPGEISKMRFAKEAGIVEMHFRIDEMVPDKKVLWTCVSCPNPAWPGTKISFTLLPSGSATDFTFNHFNWDKKWKDQLPYEQTKEGWLHFMKSIKAYCENGKGEPW